MIDKVGTIAYKLQLPPDSSIHPIFHVSQLKKSLPATAQVTTELPSIDPPPMVPIAILDRKMVKRGNQAATKIHQYR